MPQAGHTTWMLLSLALLIAGCGGGGGGGPDTPPPAPPAEGPPAPPPPPATKGLDARPNNTTCIAPERATGSTTLGVQRVFPGITFKDPTTRVSQNPIAMLQAPRDTSRWFVPGRFGVVRVFDNNPAVAAYSTFIDLTARVDSSCAECGLLGMAFHPDFPATPRAYLVYSSVQHTGPGPDTHLSEFTSPDGGLTLNPASERIILSINKANVHHHGGNIAFGPDGFLYFATGDSNDFRIDHAQRLNDLNGKMLRIDIRGTTGTALYRIPSDNPFAASTAL